MDWRERREEFSWRIGRRGACLIVLSTIFGLYGWAILRDARHLDMESTRSTLALMANILPVRAWGMIWIGAGLVALLQSFTSRANRHGGARGAFASLTFISAIWGAGTIASNILYGDWALRPLLVGGVWLSVALLTIIIAGWREDPRRYRRRADDPDACGDGG